MRHDRVRRGAVPVLLARRAPDGIALPNDLRLLSFDADQPLAGMDLENLPVFVVMPIGPGPGRERHGVDDHAVGALHREIRPDLSGELRADFSLGPVLFCGVDDPQC